MPLFFRAGSGVCVTHPLGGGQRSLTWSGRQHSVGKAFRTPGIWTFCSTKAFFFLNWRIIALQYCVGFYLTSTWISHRFTYVPSHLNIPPISHPIPPLQAVTKPGFEFPESYSKFPMAIHFGRHHWLNGREFEWAPGDGEGQGSQTCCSPWGRKESDMTERLNNNNSPIYMVMHVSMWFSPHIPPSLSSPHPSSVHNPAELLTSLRCSESLSPARWTAQFRRRTESA